MDKDGCDMICKNHSARSDRDQFRICPTKLSKQELEDLYFALVENNLELKKTINGQQDRIKMLSTKMQRLNTTQKIFKPDGRKDCCVNAKAVVNQQKEMIADLTRANERMADRIRKLNMRLCSAKQFCKSAPFGCLKCSSATSPYLIKHSPHSQRQQSQSTLKLAVSYHNLSRNTLSNKYTQTEAIESTKCDKISCEDNKCITVKDELKQEINNLLEELSHTKEEYLARINVLQMELEQSHKENVRVRSERVVIEQELLEKEQKTASLITRLRAAEGLSNELKTQFSIEHRKVAELETRLKAATMSNRVTDTIETTLTCLQESVKSRNLDVTVSPSPRSILETSAQITCSELSTKNINIDDTRLSKSTDDSGYIDNKCNDKSMEDESLNKIIEELTKRILVLQTQVDTLTISPPEHEKVTDKKIANEDLSNVKSKNELVLTSNIKDHTLFDSSDESIDTTKQNVQEIGNYDSKITDTEIKISSPKKNQNNSLSTANISEAKMSVNIDKNNDDDLKENKTLSEKLNKIFNEKEDCDIDRNIEEAKNKSTSSEEKTYTIPDKSKYINDGKMNLKDKKETDEKIYIVQDNNRDVNNSKINIKTHKKDNGEKTSIVPNKDKKVNDVKMKLKAEEKDNCFEKKKSKGKKIIKQRTITRPETIVRAKTERASCGEATYTLNNDKSSSRSSDDTDYEISSMTDLSEDGEPKHTQYLLSPGEQKFSSTQSESNNLTMDTTNYSLSEGEIPAVTGRRRSNGNITQVENSSKQTVPRMDETLHAISEEIARCKRLLFSQKSGDNVMSTKT